MKQYLVWLIFLMSLSVGVGIALGYHMARMEFQKPEGNLQERLETEVQDSSDISEFLKDAKYIKGRLRPYSRFDDIESDIERLKLKLIELEKAVAAMDKMTPTKGEFSDDPFIHFQPLIPESLRTYDSHASTLPAPTFRHPIEDPCYKSGTAENHDERREGCKNGCLWGCSNYHDMKRIFP